MSGESLLRVQCRVHRQIHLRLVPLIKRGPAASAAHSKVFLPLRFVPRKEAAPSYDDFGQPLVAFRSFSLIWQAGMSFLAKQ